ncbi:HlyD family secretion protein [Shewanella sp. UCD-KL21]|uniref:HlyD family secretion protein n=1 Tax=Shewanella sp. UCD-KL21 TaxID=1917164 RepID=UPI0009709EF0|nr:efflux RND transporter periplasmic adaptor subunit [Shewanella sp. UCD-KL21]
MKEIMLPYVLIIWLLVKLGVIQWNLTNAVRTIGLGMFIAFALFTGHRFWSPADLTDSSTIKAPHAVLSPLIGQEVENVYVTHNQFVQKGELIYTLVSVDSTEQIKALEASKNAVQAQHAAAIEQINALNVSINNDERNLARLTALKEHASQVDRDNLQAQIDANRAQVAANVAQLGAQTAQIQAIEADIESAKWTDSRREIRAQYDGQLAITNVTEGTRLGNMHLFDTSKKFLEMRIADQSYRYIKPGQFAEFYVDAYPGEIFRGRVHSITSGTGEAMINPMSGSQDVRQHVGNNSGSHGRTVVIEFEEPEGYALPIGATGSGWISAEKPHPALGFMDIIGAATVRLKALKSYLNAL